MIKLIEIFKNTMLEAKVETLTQSVLSELIKNGISAKKDGKNIRSAIPGGDESVLKSIDKIFTDKGLKYKVKIINKNEPGALSGTFKTYKITTSDGQEVNIINALKEGSTVRAKSLTPVNLKLVGKQYTSLQQLSNDIESNLSGTYKDAVSLLFNNVVKSAKSGNGKIDNNFNEVIKLDPEVIKALSKLTPQDINSISNDFGEVLGSAVLGKKFKSMDLIFPVGNEPIVDFIINGYKVSSKSGGGAAASLTKLIQDIDPKSKKTKEEKQLLDVLKPLTLDKSSGTVGDKWLMIAKNLNLPGLEILSKIMKTPIENITTKSINDYITKKGFSKAYDSFQPFFKFIKSTPTKEKDYNPSKYYGIIVGPISKYVQDEMNKNETYLNALSSIISKYDIKQLYLDTELKKGSLNFYIKSFTDPSNKFVFVGGISANNPENKNLSFKMK